MSYEFTKLSEVPAVSEFPEGANAIIETNGEIKRCPSSGGGSVPKPLTYDYMPAGYPSKSGFDIEWDGNADGLTYITDIKNYKVSDITPANDELIGATLGISNGTNLTLTSDFIYVASEDVTVVGAGNILVSIARKDNAVAAGIIGHDILFPQKGTYFMKGNKAYITRLSKQSITPMSAEFIPKMNVSAFTNDAGYLTLATLPKYEGVVE